MRDFDELYDVDDIDENHEKSKDRLERLKRSNDARAKRKLIREKLGRRHDQGYGGNLD